MNMKATHLFLGATVALSIHGCAQATGTVVVGVSGEEAATMGYPAGEIAFADGWSVTFEHLFVVVDGFEIADATAIFPTETPSTLVDLAEGDQTVWTLTSIPAQRWSQVGYRIDHPSTATRRLGAVTQADLDEMIASDVSFRVIGTATHPMHGSFDIDLALPMAAHMEGCVSGRDGTDGLVVPASGTHETQMTIHLDHLFFDSARAEEPNLRFDAWAAAAGDDRVVTYADLATQSLADLRGLDGEPLVDGEGNLVVYEPPSSGLPMQTLAAFVLAEAFTVGHFEGEGHCDYHDHGAH
jgi:hypothetical protein